MKTVKDMSEATGISIRTLRYYDEIGLLKPTMLSESGYRLYGEQELERLREILFFRNLEIPLLEIKEMLDRSDYDREQGKKGQGIPKQKETSSLIMLKITKEC
jgi:DNA-binding transcriptional MerR regulator